MVAKKLSTFLKVKYNPLIDQRDGVNCFYCEKPFPKRTIGAIGLPIDDNLIKEYDHLNNDKTWNDLVNLVHAHRICNRQKMKNQAWINKAKTKLRDNERAVGVPLAHAGTDKEISTETDSNSIYCEVVWQTLSEYLQKHGDQPPKFEQINLKEFLDTVTGKGYKKTGHGSQVTMRRIVDMFCTPEFQYVKERDERRRWIVRLRKDDEYENSDVV